MKDVFCFIPAKGASKRLKEKNIVKILGKELLGYVIEAAEKSKLFDEVIVSSESQKVLDVAKKYEVKSVKRDEKLSYDPYGIVDVLLDFFDKNKKYIEYKNVIILLPTTPTIEGDDIKKAYDNFLNSKRKALMSITKTRENSYTSVILDEDKITPIFSDKIFKKSQELPETYDLNASITILDIKTFLEKKTYFIFPMSSYILDDLKSVDINTKEDLLYAEFLLTKAKEC